MTLSNMCNDLRKMNEMDTLGLVSDSSPSNNYWSMGLYWGYSVSSFPLYESILLKSDLDLLIWLTNHLLTQKLHTHKSLQLLYCKL